VREYSRRVMDRSRQALLHAGVLHDLTQRFPADDLARAGDASRSGWRAMIASHAQDVQRYTALLRLDLQPVFFQAPPSESRAAAESPGETPLDLGDRIFALAGVHDAAVRRAFTLSTATDTELEVGTADFWRTLRATEELAQVLAGR
jgi:hypothetical protein